MTPNDQAGFVGLFDSIARDEPDRTFSTGSSDPFRFGDLLRLADAVGAALRRKGVARGDRVAAMLRNRSSAFGVLLGLARAGMVWVPVNVQQRGDGLRYILEHSEPVLILAEDDLLPALAQSGATQVAPVVPWGEFEGALGAAQAPGESPPAVVGARGSVEVPAPDALFAISYTSGTTGRPKGVMVTHRMMRLAGEGVALASGAQDGDVMLLWEPLYHIGGAQMVVLPLLRRVSLAMVDRFSASAFWQQVRECGATHIHYLGGILQILLKQPASPLDRQHAARVAWGAGCQAETWRAFEQRFGVQVHECYGMTEASSFATFESTGAVGTVGRAVPWFDVSARGQDGAVLAAGERGEIVLRATQPGAITPGYFRNPEATARVLRDGAFHTGDLGSFDGDGNLLFHGRMTDSMRVRGENVSAWEVEHVAAQHPAIEDCAMIGVAADVGEQEIKLFVQPRPGATVDPAELSAWLEPRLAAYQNPRYVAVVPGFERTPSQRIMKHLLAKDTKGCWDRLAAFNPSKAGQAALPTPRTVTAGTRT